MDREHNIVSALNARETQVTSGAKLLDLYHRSYAGPFPSAPSTLLASPSALAMRALRVSAELFPLSDCGSQILSSRFWTMDSIPNVPNEERLFLSSDWVFSLQDTELMTIFQPGHIPTDYSKRTVHCLSVRWWSLSDEAHRNNIEGEEQVIYPFLTG